MRKIFLSAVLLLTMILSTTAFAEEAADQSAEQSLDQVTEEVFGSGEEQQIDRPDEIYVYTSADFQYTITCPIKPLAVIQNPWQEPEKRGEMLIFDADGFDIHYAYYICVNAWDPDDASVPDFNKKNNTAAIGSYLTELKTNGMFGDARLVDISQNNKGVFAMTPGSIQVTDKETGEVEELVANRQDLYTFFRTPQGRCISIQLVSVNLDRNFVKTYQGSVMSFVDNSKKSKKDKKDKKPKKEKKPKK